MSNISQELREAVLQAAIQGKLTEQLPEDGDARDLLAQIKAKKERLIKEKKIKKEKPLEPILENEVPFEIPENWAWAKLGDICSVYGGKRIPAGRALSTENTGYKYIRVSDMKNGTVDDSNIMYVPVDIFPSIKKYTISKDDVYITVAGTIGRIGTVPDVLDGANLTENADKLCFGEMICKEWLVIMLNSALIQNQIVEATTQVGQPKLAILRIQELKICLPPLAEQHRIVARVEELMAKIDKLEKVENELRVLHQAFPGDMKAALLQAAMRGKLTGFDWNEDDNADLYVPLWSVTIWDKRFKGVEKKKQPCLAKYESILVGDFSKYEDDNGDVLLLSTGKYVGYTTEEKLGFSVRNAEIVSLPGGGSPDGMKYYNGKFVSADNRICSVVDSSVLDTKYLYYYLRSKMSNLENDYRGISIKHPDMKSIIEYRIPVPPLAEQKCIVEKLDQLLPLCDSLSI